MDPISNTGYIAVDLKESPSSPLLQTAPACEAKPRSCARRVLLRVIGFPIGIFIIAVFSLFGGLYTALTAVLGRFLVKAVHDLSIHGLAGFHPALSHDEMLAYGQVGMTGAFIVFSVWVGALAIIMGVMFYRLRAEERTDDAENQGPKMTLKERFKAKVSGNKQHWKRKLRVHHWVSVALIAPVGLAAIRSYNGEAVWTCEQTGTSEVDGITYASATAAVLVGTAALRGLKVAGRKIFGKGKRQGAIALGEDQVEEFEAGGEKSSL
ncbi:hypothetical protein EIP91_007093 [Steccherinum ochraceum]|uniref:Uncharacterized protein n=1 Tax=Steccherinum ochraceum TaxID=92696 RepID=A0A4V2MVG1_9APHY|nr:hypothetical protein EIP91_007093 [Steccherinum ochraceum]